MADKREPKAVFSTNDILAPNERIVSELDINVTIPAASVATLLGVGFPMAFNESTGDHAPWIAPDPTVSVITLTGATGGTFTITVNNAATAALAFDASAAVVIAALKAIGYDVTVLLASLIYTITFDGENEIKTLPTVSADLSGVTGDIAEGITVNDGTAQIASPTVLNISLGETTPATGGDFTITYAGNTSSAIAFDASASDIRTAILAISSPPASVTVSRDGFSDIAVFFDDEADLLSLPTVSANVTGLTGGTGEAALATVGDVLSLASASDIEFDVGTATGGTFTVTVNGSTTAAIAFDATVGTVDTALAAIGFDVSTAKVTTVYTITFDDKVEVITLPTLSGSIIPLTGAVVAIATTVGTSTLGTHNIRGFINPNPMQTGIQTGSITLSRSGSTTATATQTTPHGLVTGMEITVTGASDADYNVTDVAIIVTSAFTFTYIALGSDTDTDSGTYTTTNDIMTLIMVRGTIHATLPEGLVASGDLTALRTALRNGLIEKGIIVQGLAGRF